MEILDLQRLVSKGEGPQLEFKRRVNFPKKIVKEIVAFANTNGGDVLVGVGDNGRINGVKFPDDEAVLLEDAIAHLCSPEIKYEKDLVELENGRYVLRYFIPPGDQKPYYMIESKKPFVKIPFVRHIDQSVQASEEVLEILKRRQRSENISFTYGSNEKRLFSLLEENKSITRAQYQEFADISNQTASEILVTMVLANILEVIPNGEADLYVLKNNAEDTSVSYNYPVI